MSDSIFSELKRRNVFKVGTAYLVVSWLLIQVVSTITVPLALPEWVPGFFVVVLLVGFPITLIMAWAFELTPDGIKRESDITPEDSIALHTG